MFHEASRNRQEVRDEVMSLLKLDIDAGQRLSDAIASRHDGRVPRVEAGAGNPYDEQGDDVLDLPSDHDCRTPGRYRID